MDFPFISIKPSSLNAFNTRETVSCVVPIRSPNSLLLMGSKNEALLKISTEKGFIDIVKFLIEKGALVDTAILNSVKDNNELRLYLNGVKLRQNKISINTKKEEMGHFF